MAMSGSWLRLLAAFLVILVAALLHGQDSPADSRIIFRPELSSGAPFGVWVSPVESSQGRFTGPVYRPPLIPGPGGFPQITQMAGIVFSGSVTAVVRTAVASERPSTAITFKVETAIRGAKAGQTLTIREWAGLWRRGEQYRVGERVFLFLYSPSKLGFTSPVAGSAGRFAISKGKIQVNPQHVQLLGQDSFLRGRTIVPYADFESEVRRSLGME
jgi:hypothetical protein